MTLILKIENFDVLDHGGPTSLTLDRSGAEIGRGKAVTWNLPDPNRHISSCHCAVEFRDGAYWLTDLSTNGTFMQGSPHRIQGAHQIADGDRFSIGHYVVVAHLQPSAHAGAGLQQPPAATHAPAGLQVPPYGSASVPPAAVEDDPWDFGGPVEPINPMPRSGGNGRQLDDVAGDFVPQAVPMPNPGAAASLPPQGFQSSPFIQQPVYDQPPQQMPGGDDFLAAFCQGAGLNPADYPGVDMLKLATDLGQVVRQSGTEIMTMLKDRAAVKQFTKGGERTMRSATGNNPMKFLPDTTQALEAMFLKPRDGFMNGPDGFDNALRDIRRHQSAVFAALQPALASLLSGLSPDEIEDSAGSGMLGGASKGRFWDSFVERWDTKAEAGDNGMLDAFLTAFAAAYAAAAGQAGD